jgi:hypothetical protein
VHLPLSDLSPAPDSRNLDVVSKPNGESIGQHGEHPLEVLLLRVRRESEVIQLKSFPVGRLPQYVGTIVPPAVGFQEPDGARCRGRERDERRSWIQVWEFLHQMLKQLRCARRPRSTALHCTALHWHPIMMKGVCC